MKTPPKRNEEESNSPLKAIIIFLVVAISLGVLGRISLYIIDPTLLKNNEVTEVSDEQFYEGLSGIIGFVLDGFENDRQTSESTTQEAP